MSLRARIAAMVLGVGCVSATAGAAVHLFDLDGKAGVGLLAGNETSAVTGTPGSGAEDTGDISYNDATNPLFANIEWGPANGYTNLTGNATAAHVL